MSALDFPRAAHAVSSPEKAELAREGSSPPSRTVWLFRFGGEFGGRKNVHRLALFERREQVGVGHIGHLLLAHARQLQQARKPSLALLIEPDRDRPHIRIFAGCSLDAPEGTRNERRTQVWRMLGAFIPPETAAPLVRIGSELITWLTFGALTASRLASTESVAR